MDVPTQSLPQSTTPVKPVTVAALPVTGTPAAPPVTVPAQAAVTSNPAPVIAAPVTQPTSVVSEPSVFEGSYGNAPDEDYIPAAEDEYEPAPAYYETPVAAIPEVTEPKKPEAAQPPVVMPAVTSTHEPVKTLVPKTLRKVPWEQAGPGDWTEIYLGLGVTGILQSTVANCQMTNRQGNDFYFVLDKANSTLYDTSHEKRLADLLSDYFVEPVRAHIQMGEITAETPSMMAIRVREERLQDAVSAIKNDPIVQQLIAQFGATLREETIQPI
jgi:DNA polymerase-3 subunit gamma/tau